MAFEAIAVQHEAFMQTDAGAAEFVLARLIKQAIRSVNFEQAYKGLKHAPTQRKR